MAKNQSAPRRRRKRRPVSRSKAAVARRTEKAVADFLETGSITGGYVAGMLAEVGSGRLSWITELPPARSGWRLENREVLVATGGQRRWIKVGFPAASLVGSHNEAIKRYVRFNDPALLDPFAGKTAVDLRGRKYPLETRPNVLHRLANSEPEAIEPVPPNLME